MLYSEEEVGNELVLPINHDILFDNNRYRAIFTASNNRNEQ